MQLIFILCVLLCTSSLNHGDDQRGFDTVKNGGEQLGSDVVRLGTSVDKSFDFLSTPWQELVKHTVSEETLGHQYSTTASISDPSLQKSHWPTPSLPLKQPGLQSGSHSSFPGELVILLPFKLEFFSLVFLMIFC